MWGDEGPRLNTVFRWVEPKRKKGGACDKGFFSVSNAAKSKATKRKRLTRDEEVAARVGALLEEAQKFCAAVGLHKELIHEIYSAENDWTFTLKIDALLETATKEIIKSGLKLKILNRFVGAEALGEFVDGLPMNGRTSLLHLLKASGCPERMGFASFSIGTCAIDARVVDLMHSISPREPLRRKRARRGREGQHNFQTIISAPAREREGTKFFRSIGSG